MAQTKEGAQKMKATIIAKFGEDYWAKTGAIGGKTPTKTPKGFAADKKAARKAGKKGGLAYQAKKREQRALKDAEKVIVLPRKRKLFGLSLSRFKDHYEDLT